MKLLWLFVVFGVFVATTSAAYAENGSIIKITNTPTDSLSPSIAISGSDIYLVWTESSKAGFHEMFFSKSIDGGQSFSPPKNILNQKGSPLAPIISADGENVFLTWTYRYPDSYSEGRSDNNSEIFFAKSDDGGNTFSEPHLISDKETFSSVSKMAVDGENIFITWFTHSVPWKSPFKSPNEIFFAESIDGGETFGEPINLSENDGRSDSTNIATDGSNVFIVWSDDYMNNTGIFFTKSSDRGNAFSTAINISKEIPYSDGPYITSDSSNILVTWASHKEGKDPDIFFSKSTDGGTSFSDPKNISNTSGYSIISPIVTDGKNIFVAWGDSKSNSRSILLTNSTDGGETFSPPKSISNIEGVSDSPSIAYDGSNLFAVWNRQKELFKDPLEIYFSKISITNSTIESEPTFNPGNEETSDEYQKDQSPSIQIHPPETINDSIKSIKWLDENGADYSVEGVGVIRLDNGDLNLNKTLIDIPVVHVWSDTDLNGIPVDIIETGVDTGMFYADIYLSGTESSHLQLHVSNGDKITVSFEDGSTNLLLTDSVKIKSKYFPPLKQFSLGIVFDDIKCRENLELIQKYDGSPSCVKPKTKEKLVERGWTGEILDIKETFIENYSILPEVMAFYEIYEDAQVSLGDNHVSYFSGSDDGYFARMNLFFDKNYAIRNMEFHCYFQRVHQYELPSEDIALEIAKYDCKEYGDAIEQEPEEKFPGTVKVEGEMAEKICEIVGQDCLPYYIGNPQPDGSLMVGITISDTLTEKQFVFLIRNGTLTYNVTLKEN